MIIVKIFTLLTNLSQSYAIIMSSIYYKYHKNLKLFSFKNTLWYTLILHKHILTSHHLKLKIVVSLAYDFCVLTYYNMQKHWEIPY